MDGYRDSSVANAFRACGSALEGRTAPGPWLARMAGVLFAALLFGMAASASAQTQFASNVVFSADPPTYDAGGFIWARLDLDGDTADISNMALSLTLPAGVTFQSTAYSTCGGTLSQPDSTHLTITGGGFAEDVGCYLVIYFSAWPPTTTTYTLDFGTITYNTPSDNFSHTTRPALFQVAGGIPPTFSDALLEDGYVGIPYYYDLNWLLDQGTQPVTWTATGLPPGLRYDPESTGIVGTPTVEGTYLVHVHGDNGFAPPADGDFQLVVHPAPLQSSKSFSPSSISSGQTSTMTIALRNTESYDMFEVAFTDAFPSGMAAASPGSFAACGGTVTVTSTSLSLSDATIREASTCTITAPVVGSLPGTGTLVNTTSAISIVVGSGEGSFEATMPAASGSLDVSGIAPQITSPPPGASLVGAPYLSPVTVTGTNPITVTASGLPPGLFYSDGAVRGTPSIAGTYPGTLVASNGIKPDAVQSFTIVITNPLLEIVTDKLPPITGGEAVNTPVVAQGGQPPYKFDVLTGALPPGLSFDPQGFLKGVPTAAGTFDFTARVTDSTGATATHAYTIVIAKGTPSFSFELAPNPAVIGQTVVAKATLGGVMGVAAGDLQVWIAGSGERCPQMSGAQPITARTASASLASGAASFSFADLGIDHFLVCASYTGDARYKSAQTGPYDLFVIKGVLLPSPTVALTVPASVRFAATVPAQVTVSAPPGTALAPSGEVLLRVDGRLVGTARLDKGVANFSTVANARYGSMTFSATYLGDGAFAPALSGPRVVAVADVGDPANAIPSLSAGALATLAAALAAAAALSLRRRRPAAAKGAGPRSGR